jgi:hypothetical protein
MSREYVVKELDAQIGRASVDTGEWEKYYEILLRKTTERSSDEWTIVKNISGGGSYFVTLSTGALESLAEMIAEFFGKWPCGEEAPSVSE